jgi:hypothetical protein
MEKRMLGGMGVIEFLKNHNIRFNPRPWSNPTEITTKKIEVSETSFIDLHLEVASKVDALLAQLEQEENEPRAWDTIPEEEIEVTRQKIMSHIG